MPLLPRVLSRLSPILIDGSPHTAQSFNGCNADGRPVGNARLKMGFGGCSASKRGSKTGFRGAQTSPLQLI